MFAAWGCDINGLLHVMNAAKILLLCSVAFKMMLVTYSVGEQLG
jgi:hypothetical protein